MKIVFWIALFIVFYTYIGYGILLYIIIRLKRLFRGKPQKAVLPADENLPTMTLMICAYNEEDVVAEKMENTLALDYPKDKLRIMWVTDGSNDHTNELLKAYPEVDIVFSPERRGKTSALKHGLRELKTRYVAFTDANTMINGGALREIARLFADPTVGCVSGEKRVAARKAGEMAAEGEGLYWKYESTLKRWDSELYSAMGAAGELYAIDPTLCREVPDEALLDDFMLSMYVVQGGKRIAYTPDAYAQEYGSANIHEESKRKRRIAAGGLQSIWWLRTMLNPLRSAAGHISICQPPCAPMEHHPHSNGSPAARKHRPRRQGSRHVLHGDAHLADTLLPNGAGRVAPEPLRIQKQIALYRLLFRIHEF